MSQKKCRNEGRRLAQSKSGRGGRRVAPSHLERGRRSAPRRRKKRLGGQGMLLYVIFALGISTLLIGMDWIWADDVLALNRPVLTAAAETDEGDTVGQVAGKLEEQGLIEYGMVFKFFCSLTRTSGKTGEEGTKITPGIYKLDTDMDYRTLISSMGSSSANRMTTTVTVPRSMTETQIFALLEEKGVSMAEQPEEAAANYDFKLSFLKDVIPLGDPKWLEGYLFPDTYEFYIGEKPASVLNEVILRFDEIFTDGTRQEIQSNGRTIQDVVTVASMIEKETDGSDQAKTASVIHNRLDNLTSETADYPNIDATIPYATGSTEVDLSADTLHNTRTHEGLTPMAVASPGINTLKVAVYSDSTRYYFYALGDDGKHYFFATYREQQNFIALQGRYQND